MSGRGDKAAGVKQKNFRGIRCTGDFKISVFPLTLLVIITTVMCHSGESAAWGLEIT